MQNLTKILCNIFSGKFGGLIVFDKRSHDLDLVQRIMPCTSYPSHLKKELDPHLYQGDVFYIFDPGVLEY